MKRFLKRISPILVSVIIVILTATTAFAVTVYYYFGYLYTNINNDMVSLYGIDDSEMDTLFIPATLNNKKLVDIRNNAFKDNTQIRLLEFAGAVNLERIGSFAFSGCTALTDNVTLPLNIKTVETAAFEGCTSIASVVYNTSCDYVPNQCFKGCTSLSSVTLNDNIVRIGSYAFDGCSSLNYIEIPATVTDISSSAFRNIDELTLGVWYGTAGYDYAKAQNIPYVLLDGALLGDVNGDGIVNINDVTAIQQHLAEYVFLEGISLHAADADQNGEVKIDDATLLQEFLAEYTVGHPVGEVMTQ